MNPLKLAKLPKWAQEYIVEIEGQRETAAQALKQYTDEQTPSKVYVDRFECTQKGGLVFIKQYVQTSEITFNLGEKNERKDTVTVRIDRDDPTELVIDGPWSGLSLVPCASNVVKVRLTR